MSERTAQVEMSGPPRRAVSPARWARANLASTPFNAALTVVFGLVLTWAAYRLARFVFVTADWEIVRRNLRLFMVGRFPPDELWRPWVACYVLTAVFGVSLGVAAAVAAADPRAADRSPPAQRSLWGHGRGGLVRVWPVALFGVVVLALIRTPLPGLLMVGLAPTLLVCRAAGRRAPWLARWLWPIAVVAVIAALQIIVAAGGVQPEDWGGLQLTVFATVAGIAIAFPLGLIAALGRRSSLPAVRALSVGYIELLRGVPLVALLFIGQYLVIYLFPTSIDPPSFLVRALIVIALFESAYIAEIVRGGLQSIPRGQVEAAYALGLRTRQVMRRIVLPQALRNVIPALVGQFISLFKDTSLLAIVGFFEVLEVARSTPSQSDFVGRGLSSITLAFAGFIYWVGSYTLSRESRLLEKRLGVGVR